VEVSLRRFLRENWRILLGAAAVLALGLFLTWPRKKLKIMRGTIVDIKFLRELGPFTSEVELYIKCEDQKTRSVVVRESPLYHWEVGQEVEVWVDTETDEIYKVVIRP